MGRREATARCAAGGAVRVPRVSAGPLRGRLATSCFRVNRPSFARRHRNVRCRPRRPAVVIVVFAQAKDAIVPRTALFLFVDPPGIEAPAPRQQPFIERQRAERRKRAVVDGRCTWMPQPASNGPVSRAPAPALALAECR